MLITVVEIMVSFTKSGIDFGIIVTTTDYERSTPHSIALIFLHSKMYILFEKNYSGIWNYSLKFKKILFFDQHSQLPLRVLSSARF